MIPCYSGVNHLLQFVFVDIDTIEIRSDEDEGSGAIKARRTYNYRVRALLFLSFSALTGVLLVSEMAISPLFQFLPLCKHLHPLGTFKESGIIFIRAELVS